MDKPTYTALTSAGINVERALCHMNDSEERLKRYLRMFLQSENYEQLITLMPELTQDNRREVGRCSHSMKGVAATLGMDKLSEIFAVMTHEAESAQPERLEQLWSEARAEYEVIKSAVDLYLE